MKTWLRVVLLAATLILLSESVFAVGIRGSSSCGVWVTDRNKNDMAALRNEAWLVGFLSGQAFWSNKEFWGGKDRLDNESVFLWMDNYCRANPLKTIADGADILFEERTKGKK